MDIRQRYFNNYRQIARDDLCQSIVPEYYAQSHVRRLLKYAGRYRYGWVLDLGCGKGEFLKAIPHSGKLGVDISPEYVEYIRKQNIPAICADVENLSLSSKYDLIVATDVLEHVLHPEMVLKAIRRHLARAGMVIIRVPFQEDISVYKTSKYEFVHLRSFTLASLRALLLKEELVITKVYYETYSVNTFRYKNRYVRYVVSRYFNGPKWDRRVLNAPLFLSRLIARPLEITVIARVGECK